MTDTTTATEIPPRPKYYHDAVRGYAVDAIIDEVSEWLQESAQFTQKSLKEVLVRCINANAYDYARELEERYGWAPTARLVEILNQLDLFAATEKVVAEWVAEYSVKMDFKVGDRVSTPTIKSGTVKRLLVETAQISIEPDDYRQRYPEMKIGVNVDFEDAIHILGTIGKPVPAPEGGTAS